ncbi:hypothetical protein cce_3811 [Crocosphaera subtropica ATCC 51142]|uniref:Uncharacterized protein n=1 Tax=Crocosphaera subtropica (strain ATCC 51142 / BH68) TaxID=43989 RepID=B1WNY0_CROS5|nr:hypothetical protein cce_3811 [Crocosphaera subtropica ATCC 51142]
MGGSSFRPGLKKNFINSRTFPLIKCTDYGDVKKTSDLEEIRFAVRQRRRTIRLRSKPSTAQCNLDQYTYFLLSEPKYPGCCRLS